MRPAKFVIFNADDFGYGHGISRGIAEAHQGGVVTSTSLMVNTPGTDGAVALAAELPDLSVGLHVNFTNEAERLIDFYDPRVARDELYRQFDRFTALMKRLPTHLDSHQHVHRVRECRPAFEALAVEHGLHLRDAAPVTYKGGFYGQWEYGVSDPSKVSFEALAGILRREIDSGLFEMCVHPGHVDADFESVYHADRECELATLTDPRVRTVLAQEGIRLIGYRDLDAVLAETGRPPLERRAFAAGHRLKLLGERFVICRFSADRGWPSFPADGSLLSVTRSATELSVVCAEQFAPSGGRVASGWRGLQVEGPLDLATVGVLAGLTAPLAQAGVALFAISSFDTDHLLVREADLGRAVSALRAAGHEVHE